VQQKWREFHIITKPFGIKVFKPVYTRLWVTFSRGYLNSELNCTTVNSNSYCSVNNHSLLTRLVFLNMQYHLTLETKVGVKYLETVLNTKSNLTDRVRKQSPSFCCVCNSLHIFLLAWPFPVSAVLSGKCLSRSHETFLSMEWQPCTFRSPPLLRSVSTASIRSTLNLKWYILGWPQFALHITTQFRRVSVVIS
jgi:hypothetical protein